MATATYVAKNQRPVYPPGTVVLPDRLARNAVLDRGSLGAEPDHHRFAVGMWMLNRVPLVLTLRSPRGYTVAQVRDGQIVEWRYQDKPQVFFLIRLIYFLLIGWWFSLTWSLLAWLLCVSIIGLPFGVWMFNRLPGVTTLMRH